MDTTGSYRQRGNRQAPFPMPAPPWTWTEGIHVIDALTCHHIIHHPKRSVQKTLPQECEIVDIQTLSSPTVGRITRTQPACKTEKKILRVYA